MQTETIRSSYLNIRISELSKNLLRRAAELEGDSLSHFVVSRALEGAYKLLSEPQTVSLSPTEQMQFLRLLENPAPMNAKLSKAVKRYKEVQENGSDV